MTDKKRQVIDIFSSGIFFSCYLLTNLLDKSIMHVHNGFVPMVKLKDIAGGLISTATDLVLLSVFYGVEVSLGGTKSLKMSGSLKAGDNALATLEEVNSKTILRAIKRLKEKGLVESVKGKINEINITDAGRLRLSSKIPKYDSKRVWDGNIYTVTYDIPVKQNNDRNALRIFLRKIGCALLQESVWITPYNPTSLIRDFAKERDLQGTILVSSLGRDGAIGEQDRESLIEQIYNLKGLSARYGAFINKYGTDLKNRSMMIMDFLSILQDDPQLPFVLLPDYWQGDVAYKIFVKNLRTK